MIGNCLILTRKTAKFFALLLLLCLTLGLTACSGSSGDKDGYTEDLWGKNRNKETPTPESTPTEASTPTPTPVPTDTPTPAPTNSPTPTSTPTPTPTNTPTPTPSPAIDIENTSFARAGEFSEGVAWVLYMDANSKYNLALVNRAGNTFCEFKDIGYNVYASPMSDGVSFIRVGNVANNRFFDTGYEMIVDRDGTMLYRTAQIEDSYGTHNEHIYAAGDGMFLVQRKESGMQGIEWTIGVIDRNGAEIKPFVKSPMENSIFNHGDEFTDHDAVGYLGEGFFAFTIYQRDYVYDTTNNLIMYSHVEPEYIGEIQNGRYFAGNYIVDTTWFDPEQPDPGSDEQNRLDIIDFSENDFAGTKQIKYIYDDLAGVSRPGAGLLYYRHGFYDLNGNRAISIPNYEDLKIWCSAYNNDGYAIMVIVGADHYYYVTVIDRNAKELFTPFRINYDKNLYSRLVNISDHIECGRFVCQTDDGLCIFNAYTGEKMQTLYAPAKNKTALVWAIGNGYVIYDGEYGHRYAFFPESEFESKPFYPYDSGSTAEIDTTNNVYKYFSVDEQSQLFLVNESVFGKSYAEFKELMGVADLAAPEAWPYWGTDLSVVFVSDGRDTYACLFQNDRLVQVYRDTADSVVPADLFEAAHDAFGKEDYIGTYNGATFCRWKSDYGVCEHYMENYGDNELHYRQTFISNYYVQ